MRNRETVVSYRDQTVKQVYEKLKRQQQAYNELDFIRESSSELSGSESDRSSTSSSSNNRRIYSNTRPSVDQRNVLVSVTRPSILSSEYKSQNPVSYQGFINLALTMLVVSHLRLILENFQKYGFVFNTWDNLMEFVSDPSAFPSLSLTCSFTIWILLSYLVEKVASTLVKPEYEKFLKQRERLVKKKKEKSSRSSTTKTTTAATGATTNATTATATLSDSEQSSTSQSVPPQKEQQQKAKKTFADLWKKMINRIQIFAFVCHTLIISSLLLAPVLFIHIVNPHPVASMLNCALLTIILLKLVSYAVVNSRLREAMYDPKKREESPGPLRYPENVSILNLFYFMFAPTLVYEENFPRNKSIRWDFLAKRSVELVFFSAVIVVMVEQYIVPLVKSSMRPMKENDVLRVFERLLKLTIPNIVVWVLGFYTFFHLFLNVLSEILCYGDRLFYLEWWNATTMGYFWRTWNKPVNCWMVNHIYNPLLSRGYTQNMASFLVFFVSAFFHEFVVSVPFRSLKLWSFSAMILQVPLSYLTRKYTKGKVLGNILFWASFMFGQANCILLYYYSFIAEKQNNL